MLKSNLIVWKVNALFFSVILLALGVLGYVGKEVYERDALESARDVSKITSETILRSIRKLMMTRDNAGVKELIDSLAEDNPVYKDIRLISHDGRVVASRSQAGDVVLEMEAGPCRACHPTTEPADTLTLRSHEEVIELPYGERIVSVVTPIFNELDCSTSECHAHREAGPVLGLLQTDYSLRRVDQLISAWSLRTGAAALLAILLSGALTWFLMYRLVGRRVQALMQGVRRVAVDDFGFKFEDERRDEIGALSESFNDMTSKLSSTLSELRNTRDYLEGIVENSADMIITVDLSGRIQTFNRGAETVLGYQRDEVVGERIEMLFADPNARNVAIARLKDTDNVVNYETRFVTQKGEIRDVILTLSRLRTPDGTAIGTFGISKDVTQEKRLLRELLLKEKLAAVGQAVTGIQHSLKNMLNSLKGGSYMVNTGLSDNDRDLLEEGWVMVQEGITRVTDLSSRMLNYVKEWEPEVEEIDITGLLESIYNLSKEAALREGIELQIEIAGELGLVNCDRQLLHSAVTDLLANAFDACLRKDYGDLEVPEVVLRAYRSKKRDGFVMVEVRDNGEGMTEEIKKNIFTPFFSTKKKLGTGVGLTLTSRIIRQHGGESEVESELGEGTIFRFSLPVKGPQK
jgi:PAS domain S-box-containing protein